MAKVTDIFVNGSVGNVIFYRCMGTRVSDKKNTYRALGSHEKKIYEFWHGYVFLYRTHVKITIVCK